MPLSFDPYEEYTEGTEFQWYGRVVRFCEQDATPEHKERIGALPDTFVKQLVLEIEGVSIEWVGEDGNLRRFTADKSNADGSEKAGRGGRAKWSAMLAPIIAPTDAEAALRGKFRKHGPDGRSWVGAPGLGYDGKAPDFPECLEGHIFLIENRRIEFGTNRLTGETIATNIPALVRQEDDFVYEGTPPQFTYGGGATATAPTDAEVVEGPAAQIPSPAQFFTAIDGVRADFHALHEALATNGADVEPYRTMAIGSQGRQNLVNKGIIEVGSDQIIRVLLESIPDTVEELKELAG